MLTSAMAGITVAGFWSQSGAVMPMAASALFTGDNSGLNRNSQMAATATLEVTTGAK